MLTVPAERGALRRERVIRAASPRTSHEEILPLSRTLDFVLAARLFFRTHGSDHATMASTLELSSCPHDAIGRVQPTILYLPFVALALIYCTIGVSVPLFMGMMP